MNIFLSAANPEREACWLHLLELKGRTVSVLETLEHASKCDAAVIIACGETTARLWCVLRHCMSLGLPTFVVARSAEKKAVEEHGGHWINCECGPYLAIDNELEKLSKRH